MYNICYLGEVREHFWHPYTLKSAASISEYKNKLCFVSNNYVAQNNM